MKSKLASESQSTWNGAPIPLRMDRIASYVPGSLVCLTMPAASRELTGKFLFRAVKHAVIQIDGRNFEFEIAPNGAILWGGREVTVAPLKEADFKL